MRLISVFIVVLGCGSPASVPDECAGDCQPVVRSPDASRADVGVDAHVDPDAGVDSATVVTPVADPDSGTEVDASTVDRAPRPDPECVEPGTVCDGDGCRCVSCVCDVACGDECDVLCRAASCNVRGDDVEDVRRLQCSSSSTCNFEFTDSTIEVECNSNARCNTVCDGGHCEVDCVGAQCRLDCDDAECHFRTCAGTVERCSDGSMVCGRDC